jgi:hypothetical protein
MLSLYTAYLGARITSVEGHGANRNVSHTRAPGYQALKQFYHCVDLLDLPTVKQCSV